MAFSLFKFGILFIWFTSLSCNHVCEASWQVTHTSSSFSLSNGHRPNSPKLKVSIPVSINQLYRTNQTFGSFSLTDASTVEIEQIDQQEEDATQWNLLWRGGKQNQNREVCIHYGGNNATWFNTYQSVVPNWPMNSAKEVSRIQFSFVSHFGTVPTEFNSILEYLFVSSDGFALLLDPHCPWFIRIDPNVSHDPLMCFSVNRTFPYMESNTDPSYLDIKIHFFAAKNIRQVSEKVLNSTFIAKPVTMPPSRQFIYPAFETYAITEWVGGNLNDTLSHFQNQIVQNGFSDSSEVILGNYKNGLGHFHPVDVYDLDMAALRNQGKFYYTLGVYDKVNTALTTEWPQESLMLRSKNGENYHRVDYSKNESCNWFRKAIEKVTTTTGIDSFNLRWFGSPPGDPQIQYSDQFIEKYPTYYNTRYLECAASGNNVSSLRHFIAFRSQHLPASVLLYKCYEPNISMDEHMRSLIPTALTASLGGYSFFAHSIGTATLTVSSEMYIRWVQAVALMPQMAFQHAPWTFNNSTVLNIVRKFVKLHEQYSPIILELVRARVQHGSPIIRPVWYVAPDDPNTYKIDDQFMLGDDILVAPVLGEGQRQRTVYLPNGNWSDLSGRVHQGEAEIQVQVPLDELPIYERYNPQQEQFDMTH